ncbi:MAG: hypothetical protein B7Z52_06450 [Burkholderiales bacterium 12-64-5]|nr:MAG: hypothetical protein B7Z52_06450 [Burkholderiales bacterium 12-64-5]
MTISGGGQESGNEQQTTIFGYGEINYNRPRNNSADTQLDVRRAIIGFGHRFDERTRFAMELEFEHAVTSADDSGEVAVEQAYIDHAFKPGLGVQAGLFLLPVGFLNRRHEPTAYYGVERNFVETAIVSSTWREGGASLRGDTESGLVWSTGLTTGFDLSKWDLSGMYAAGRISGTADLNLVTIGNPTPIPKAFFGWYLQGAYTVWTRNERSLSPFVRYERYNTASQYAAFPPGLGIDPGQTERVVTAGASFRLNPNVVFKADYQKFDIDPSRDRFNLGIGYAF